MKCGFALSTERKAYDRIAFVFFPKMVVYKGCLYETRRRSILLAWQNVPDAGYGANRQSYYIKGGGGYRVNIRQTK